MISTVSNSYPNVRANSNRHCRRRRSGTIGLHVDIRVAAGVSRERTAIDIAGWWPIALLASSCNSGPIDGFKDWSITRAWGEAVSTPRHEGMTRKTGIAVAAVVRHVLAHPRRFFEGLPLVAKLQFGND